MPRSFNSLKLEYTERTIKEFAIEIAEEYACTSKTKGEIARENDLCQKAVTELMDYAIVHYLVSDETVDKMMNKSFQNQRRHSPDGSAESTILHYQALRKKRMELIIFKLSDKKIKEIADYFANNPKETKEKIAERYGLSKKVIDIVLKKAITERLCDDETFEKIRDRSLTNCEPANQQKTEIFFNNLEARRNFNKKGNFFA